MSDPARILVLGYRHLGDCLFLTPMLRALKRRFPEAHVAVTAHGAGAAVLESSRHVDRVWRLPGRGLRAKLSLLPELHEERFDAGIMAQHSLANALLLRLIGCRVRVGLATRGCGPLLTHAIRVPQRKHPCHEADRYLALAAALGAAGDGAGLEFTPTADDRAAAAAALARLGLAGRFSAPAAGRPPLVALFPGSSPEWSCKRWPAERFAALGRRLVEERGARVIVVGGRNDLPIMQEVSAALAAPHAVDAEPGPLGRDAALLAECDLLVANDSGPMHLATAVGTRVVDLAGPTDPRCNGPYGSGHVVVQKVPPGSLKAWARESDPALPMKLIDVEDVVAAVAPLLAAPAAA
jgi:heptosyltransferase-2